MFSGQKPHPSPAQYIQIFLLLKDLIVRFDPVAVLHLQIGFGNFLVFRS